MNFTESFLAEAREIIDQVDCEQVEALVARLVKAREEGGRISMVN